MNSLNFLDSLDSFSEVGVGVFDDGCLLLSCGVAGYFDVEQVAGVWCELDLDAVFGDELFGLGECFWGEVFEYL